MFSVQQMKRWFRSGLWKQHSRPVIEVLQDRCLLSAGNVTVEPSLSASPLAASSARSGYTPAQVKAEYGPSSSSMAEAGGAITIVQGYNDPNISADLTDFDKPLGLVAPSGLENTSEMGNTGQPPASNASWGVGTSLDGEWAHAIALNANILLVEADSSSLNDLLTAVNYATTASIAPTAVAIAVATNHATVDPALLVNTGSFAGVAYQGFESPVDGISWAIPAKLIDESALPVAIGQSSSAADQSFQTITPVVIDSAPVLETVSEGNLDTLNLSSSGSSRVLASALLVGSSAPATNVYSMAVKGMSGVVAPPAESSVSAASDQNESGTTLSMGPRLAGVVAHPFSIAAIPAGPDAGHFGEVLVAVAGGIAVAALLVREREPRRDEVIEGFIYNLDR